MDDDVYFEFDERDCPVKVRRTALPAICEARVVPLGFSQRRGMPALPSDEVLVVATGHRGVGNARRDQVVIFHGDQVTVEASGSATTLIERRRERQLLVGMASESADAENEAAFLRAFRQGREVGICSDVMLALVPDGRQGMKTLPDWREEAVRLAMFHLEVEVAFWRGPLGSTGSEAASAKAAAMLRSAEIRLARYRGWPPNALEQVQLS